LFGCTFVTGNNYFHEYSFSMGGNHDSLFLSPMTISYVYFRVVHIQLKPDEPVQLGTTWTETIRYKQRDGW